MQQTQLDGCLGGKCALPDDTQRDLIACAQALKLRLRQGEITAAMLPAGVAALMERAPLIEEDAPLDKVLAELTGAIARRDWRCDWPGDAEPAG